MVCHGKSLISPGTPPWRSPWHFLWHVTCDIYTMTAHGMFHGWNHVGCFMLAFMNLPMKYSIEHVMVAHGIFHAVPWAPWNAMGYHGIPWYLIWCHGQFHGVPLEEPWDTMGCHCTSWYVPWCFINFHDIHGMPRNPMTFHDICIGTPNKGIVQGL